MSETVYHVAERFKSIQGEGLFAGTPMAFIRFVGCSVGKKICHGCDTDYDRVLPWRGGGEYTPEALAAWASTHRHVCLTGGEPFDQDLAPLLEARWVVDSTWTWHIETSGTRPFQFSSDVRTGNNGRVTVSEVWISCSPKPGFLESQVLTADEIKVIVPGLGNGPGWPTLEDALRWASAGKIVYLQPRNSKHELDRVNLRYALDLVEEHPELRLSVQMHKVLGVQ